MLCIMKDNLDEYLEKNKHLTVNLMKKIVIEDFEFVQGICKIYNYKYLEMVYIYGLNRDTLNGKNKKKLRQEAVKVIEMYEIYLTLENYINNSVSINHYDLSSIITLLEINGND